MKWITYTTHPNDDKIKKTRFLIKGKYIEQKGYYAAGQWYNNDGTLVYLEFINSGFEWLDESPSSHEREKQVITPEIHSELKVMLNLCDHQGKPYDGFRFRDAVLNLRKLLTTPAADKGDGWVKVEDGTLPTGNHFHPPRPNKGNGSR